METLNLWPSAPERHAGKFFLEACLFARICGSGEPICEVEESCRSCSRTSSPDSILEFDSLLFAVGPLSRLARERSAKAVPPKPGAKRLVGESGACGDDRREPPGQRSAERERQPQSLTGL